MSIISTENAEHYLWGDNCDGWHLVKSANLSVIQESVPPNCSEKRHYHEKAEQFFFILKGKATMELNGKEYIIDANQGIHIPAGAVHKLSNKQQSDLIFTVTSTPPSHGDRQEV